MSCPACASDNVYTRYTAPPSYECQACKHTWRSLGSAIRILSEEEGRKLRPKLYEHFRPRVALQKAELQYLQASGWILYCGVAPECMGHPLHTGEGNKNLMTIDAAVLRQKAQDDENERRTRERTG